MNTLVIGLSRYHVRSRSEPLMMMALFDVIIVFDNHSSRADLDRLYQNTFVKWLNVNSKGVHSIQINNLYIDLKLLWTYCL